MILPRSILLRADNVTFYVPVNDRAGPSPRRFNPVRRSPVANRRGRSRASGSEALLAPSGRRPEVSVTPRLWTGSAARSPGSGIRPRWFRCVLSMDRDGSQRSRAPGDRRIQAEAQARSLSAGTLEMLAERFGGGADHHADLTQTNRDLEDQKRRPMRKGANERKADIDRQVAELEYGLPQRTPRAPVRPTTGLWVGYRARDRRKPAAGARPASSTARS